MGAYTLIYMTTTEKTYRTKSKYKLENRRELSAALTNLEKAENGEHVLPDSVEWYEEQVEFWMKYL